MKKLLSCLLTLAVLTSLALPARAADDVYLSDIKDRLISYSGLENKLGYDTAHSGDKIKIGGMWLEKGLGIHCNETDPTYIEFDISGYSYKYLDALIGMQTYSASGVFLDWGSAIFSVYGDEKQLYVSDTLNYGEEPAAISVPVEGVKTLRLQTSNAGGYSCDWCIWGEVRLSDEKEIEVTTEYKPTTENTQQTDAVKSAAMAYISDMTWGDCVNYDGSSITKDGNHYNEEIWHNGKFYAKGIGMHASPGGSYLELNLEGCAFTRFYALGMVSDTLSAYNISMASVQFVVYGDGAELCRSETIKYDEKYAEISVDITGVKVLKLLIDPTSDGISGDWGTWADALVCKGEPDTYLTEDVTTAQPATDTATAAIEQTDGATDSKTEEQTQSGSITHGGRGLWSTVGIIAGIVALSIVCGVIFTRRKKK